MMYDGDESPIPENPFEMDIGAEAIEANLEKTNFNFKENLMATTGVQFAE